MHEVIFVEVLDRRADIPKIAFDELLVQLSITKFDFFIKGTSGSILEDHISHILFLFVIIVD